MSHQRLPHQLLPHQPLSQWSSAQNILIIRLDNIGDVLMLSPALRAIKETLPQSQITLMASPSGSQAATLLPWIDNLLTVRSLWQEIGQEIRQDPEQNTGNVKFDPAQDLELIQTLRDRRFDAAIVFTSFSQTPHAAGYMCYLAGIPLRLGESKEWGGSVFTTEIKSAPDEIHQVERNLRLIESVGFQVSDRTLRIGIAQQAQAQAFARLQQQGLLKANDAYIVLNPWASCQARSYFLERFAISARQLADITGYRVVVTGVAKDIQRSAPLFTHLSNSVNLMGATTLAELAALIANAKLLLSNNTSTLHIADATRTPSVILYSGTDYESQWQPRHSATRLLRQPTPCSPCYAFTCPYNLECLDISAQDVVEAGLALLKQNS
jgi:ADP-heptose:LPS heptosyltransferase